MNGRSAFSVSVILGVLSLVLLVTNVALINSNRHQQENANQRQAEINKGRELTQLNQALVQALAEAAVSTNDTAAKELLAGQGITINQGATPARGSSASSPVEVPVTVKPAADHQIKKK